MDPDILWNYANVGVICAVYSVDRLLACFAALLLLCYRYRKRVSFAPVLSWLKSNMMLLLRHSTFTHVLSLLTPFQCSRLPCKSGQFSV